MTTMQTLFSQPWVERLGMTLLHFLWQGLLIAVLYAAARRILARASGPQTITPVQPRLPARWSGETPAEADRKIRRRVMVISAILAVLIAGGLLVTCPGSGN